MDIQNHLSKDGQQSIRAMIQEKRQKRRVKEMFEKLIPKFLLTLAMVSILTTIGIIFTLLSETIEYFKRVPMMDFFTGTVLKPLSQTPEFGVLPLIM